MIANRWMIPAGFGAVCAALAVTSMALSEKGVVHATEAGFTIGQSHALPPMPLEKDKRYTLMLKPTSGVMINSEVVVSATLSREDAVVFEIEDAYWHERGTWREGGESGTWEEQNSNTQFSFVVPEDGNYDLEVTLESATSIAGDRLEILVGWQDPWMLTTWPLAVGALALFALAGFAHINRRKVMGTFLEDNVGEGSKLEIDGVEYTVIGRMEHWEWPDRVGVEFRLRDSQGKERWLAIERFWREHPYIEDGEQTLVQTLIDVPMTPEEEQLLAGHDQGVTHVAFKDEIYVRDRENCGWGTLVTIRDGTAYQTRYEADVYRDDRGFPREPGDIWIECLIWRDSQEIEWAAMQLTDTDNIKIVHLEEAETMSHHDISLADAQQDPFGVSHLRGPRAQVNRTGASAPAEQQQQQAHWNNSNLDS